MRFRSTITNLGHFWFPQEVPTMPSPFPGMDPYWKLRTSGRICTMHWRQKYGNHLNQTLPTPDHARLEMRPELGIIEERGVRQRITPDVTVVRHSEPEHQQRTGATAVLTAPRSVISTFIEYEVLTDPIHHQFVEIRSFQGHKLITLIEIVSPSRPGPDRESYERKQREILESDASLVELDLWRRPADLARRRP